MHSGSPNKKHHDVWQWFDDEETRTGKSTAKHGKKRVYCAQCLSADITVLRERDDHVEGEHTDVEHYTECEWDSDWVCVLC